MSRFRNLSSLLRNAAYYGGGVVGVVYAGQTVENRYKKSIHSSIDFTHQLDQTLKCGFAKFFNFLLPIAHCAHAFDAYMLQMTQQEFEAKSSTELYEIFKGRLGTDFGPHKPLHFFIVGDYANDVEPFLPVYADKFKNYVTDIFYDGKNVPERYRKAMWLPRSPSTPLTRGPPLAHIVIKMVWNKEAATYDFFMAVNCHVLLEVDTTVVGNNIVINPVKIITVTHHSFAQEKKSGEYYNSIEPMWLIKGVLAAFRFHKRATPP